MDPEYFPSNLEIQIQNHQSVIARLTALKSIDPMKMIVVTDRVQRVLGDDEAWGWLTRPNIALAGLMPLEAVLEGQRDAVYELIAAMAYNLK
jgi:hypothetical protein